MNKNRFREAQIAGDMREASNKMRSSRVLAGEAPKAYAWQPKILRRI